MLQLTPEEIKIIINSMKNGKVIGPYNILVYLLKILSEFIAVSLSDIINNSFSSGVLPDLMKLAKVIPLYKKSLPEDPINHRPISLLSVSVRLLKS